MPENTNGPQWGERTLAIHAGEGIDPVTRASSPNLVMSSTFAPSETAGFSARNRPAWLVRSSGASCTADPRLMRYRLSPAIAGMSKQFFVVSETGLEREAADAFGLARFGDFELFLQSGDVFLDFR